MKIHESNCRPPHRISSACRVENRKWVLDATELLLPKNPYEKLWLSLKALWRCSHHAESRRRVEVISDNKISTIFESIGIQKCSNIVPGLMLIVSGMISIRTHWHNYFPVEATDFLTKFKMCQPTLTTCVWNAYGHGYTSCWTCACVYCIITPFLRVYIYIYIYTTRYI